MGYLLNHRWASAFTVIVAVIAALWAALALGQRPSPPVRTAPPTMKPALSLDTGWHMLMDPGGRIYRLDKRYDELSDVERDAANKFARSYPSGLG